MNSAAPVNSGVFGISRVSSNTPLSTIDKTTYTERQKKWFDNLLRSIDSEKGKFSFGRTFRGIVGSNGSKNATYTSLVGLSQKITDLNLPISVNTKKELDPITNKIKMFIQENINKNLVIKYATRYPSVFGSQALERIAPSETELHAAALQAELTALRSSSGGYRKTRRSKKSRKATRRRR